MLVRVEWAATYLTRGLSKIGLLILIGFAGSTLVDALARTLANFPIDLVRDIGGLTAALAISFCFPQGFLEGSNIVISSIDDMVTTRTRYALEAFAAVVTTTIMLLFALQFLNYSMELDKTREVTVMLDIPVAPFWYIVDGNLWLTVFVQVLVSARALSCLWQPASP
jgi:TRAP-type C4-dicarboxylate transport system permease small subunit